MCYAGKAFQASTTIEGGPGGGTFIRPYYQNVGLDGSSDSNKFNVFAEEKYVMAL